MAEEDAQDAPQANDGVGARLRKAREAAGLSRADVAAQTKIAERHLIAIEEDRFADLASRAYAVGFSRTFARAVGLDEMAIAAEVRASLDAGKDSWERSGVTVFEPGDPARVPPSRVAWMAALGALAVVGIVFLFWRSYYDPAISLPDLTTPELTSDEAAQAGSAGAVQPDGSALPTGGAVTFTALEPDIWVKFYDAAGVQLMQKQMAQGETYTIPAEAQGPMVWTARPDALAITVDGRPVPRLAETPITVKDTPVTAAALAGRMARAAGAASAPSASMAPVSPARAASAPPQAGRPVARPPVAAATPTNLSAPTDGVAPGPDPSAPPPSTVSE